MSSSDSAATMPPMIALLRTAGFPSRALKLLSCLYKYSGIWPAMMGFADVGLLPSAP
ncbi:MAG: hypothetical protein AW09_001854 [Candidatus Accumulibacter phosphatis]|uniref:Uncharacterized protein n=1 Tax=Candidatus Accumulibacter phosphatis TaxID=327160 RepID=A0A080LYE1_9PROT|nr:MAG: hypothetical protein AW09_001854 [Candidatus Accumulibacter phosphatis]